jgi:hypothetical protein
MIFSFSKAAKRAEKTYDLAKKDPITTSDLGQIKSFATLIETTLTLKQKGTASRAHGANLSEQDIAFLKDSIFMLQKVAQKETELEGTTDINHLIENVFLPIIVENETAVEIPEWYFQAINETGPAFE